MATLEFETHSSVLPAPAVTASPFRQVGRSARKRLALFRPMTICAASPPIPAVWKSSSATVFEVTVFDLDQYLLRSTHGRVRKFGDRHIQDICREIRYFDASICSWSMAHWAAAAATSIGALPGFCGPRRGSR